MISQIDISKNVSPKNAITSKSCGYNNLVIVKDLLYIDVNTKNFIHYCYYDIITIS
jgi:hypothetical protein